MPVPQARELLSRCGGQLVHVFCEDGFRVSYRPYREMSEALMRLLKTFPAASVVQKASIDEAFISCRLAQNDPFVEGTKLASEIREATRRELGLTVSVGVAANPLLAKLASARSKPDGLLAIDNESQLQALLQATPVRRLPGVGGSLAAALLQAGLQTAWSLRAITPQQLAAATGAKLAVAEKLVGFGHGHDPTAVVDKGPPKSIQVQMTLTPVPLPAPHSRDLPAAGGRPGMLLPLPAGEPGSLPRLQQLLRAMSLDLVSRVLLDRSLWERWPSKLSLQLVSHGLQGRTTSQTAVFPTTGMSDGDRDGNSRDGGETVAPHLHGVDGAAPGSGAAVPSVAGMSLLVGERSIKAQPALLDAVCGVSNNMASAMMLLHAPSAPLVQVHVTVSGFQPMHAASSRAIKQFFQPKGPAIPSGSACQNKQRVEQGNRDYDPEQPAPLRHGGTGPSSHPVSGQSKRQRVSPEGEAIIPPAGTPGLQQLRACNHLQAAAHPALRVHVDHQAKEPIDFLRLLETLPVGPHIDASDAWTAASHELDARLNSLGLSRCLG